MHPGQLFTGAATLSAGTGNSSALHRSVHNPSRKGTGGQAAARPDNLQEAARLAMWTGCGWLQTDWRSASSRPIDWAAGKPGGANGHKAGNFRKAVCEPNCTQNQLQVGSAAMRFTGCLTSQSGCKLTAAFDAGLVTAITARGMTVCNTGGAAALCELARCQLCCSNRRLVTGA